MLPLNLRQIRLPWRLRLWLLPFAVMLAILACESSSPPPPMLEVQQPTSTPTQPIPITPTPSMPAEAALNIPADPDLQAMLDQVESDRLMVSVGSLVDMHTRHVLSKTTQITPGISAARDWLIAQFQALKNKNPQQPITIWTQDVKYTWNGFAVASQNVIATFQGNDIGAGVIVVGAHYDTMSTDYTNGQAYSPGADYNASGVAAMLEIANILAPQPHRATILFVAFTGEETGRQGSAAFVKQYIQAQVPPVDVRGMINLDSIGSALGASGETDRQTLRLFSAEPNDSSSRQLARQLALIIKTYVPGIKPILESAEDRTGRSGDQQSFSSANTAAVRMIQGIEDVSREHTIRDTVDTVQADYLMQTTRAGLASVAVLADGPQPPGDLVLRAVVDDPANQRLVWTPVQGAAVYLVTLRLATSLSYDQIFTVQAAPTSELTWTGFGRYATVAIAAIDSAGHMGPLSPEANIASLVRQR